MSEEYYSPDYYQDPITNEWKPSRPIAISKVKARRDRLLYESDWTQLPNNPLGDKQELWATYRQQLRDIPKQADFPFNVVWPTAPQK
jgi:hypothetical protein